MGKPRSPLREHELRALGAYAHTCVKSGKAAMNDVCVCVCVTVCYVLKQLLKIVVLLWIKVFKLSKYQSTTD